MKDHQNAASKRSRERKKAAMAADPEYAATEKAKANEKAKRAYAARKARLDDLRARAGTDPAAARELADIISNATQATEKCHRKLAEQAQTDPDAAAKLETRLEHHREYCRDYYKKHKGIVSGEENFDASA